MERKLGGEVGVGCSVPARGRSSCKDTKVLLPESKLASSSLRGVCVCVYLLAGLCRGKRLGNKDHDGTETKLKRERKKVPIQA